MSFEAPAMEVLGLIQRWRDRARREEKERERARLKAMVMVACVELWSSCHGDVGLIQRWRDQVRREEKERQRGLRLIVFAEKKKNW